MFKNNERRFEYDIGPHAPEELESYSHKYGHRMGSDYPISATTPINRRVSVNQPNFNTREKHHISTQEPGHYFQGIQESQMARQRGNSASGFKRSVEKGTGKNQKSFVSHQNFKQTKKVYFGNDPYAKHVMPNSRSQSHNRGDSRTNENRRQNGQEMTIYNFQGPSHNQSSHKQSNHKQNKIKKQESRWNEVPEYNLNQKEIMQKIGRINRLNEEINSRLQRMLSKIENS